MLNIEVEWLCGTNRITCIHSYSMPITYTCCMNRSDLFQVIRIHGSCFCKTWHIEARLDPGVLASVSAIVSRDVEVYHIHIVNHFIDLPQVWNTHVWDNTGISHITATSRITISRSCGRSAEVLPFWGNWYMIVRPGRRRGNKDNTYLLPICDGY